MAHKAAALLLALLPIIGGTGAACSSKDAAAPNQRTCGLTIWHQPASTESHVEIVGDWNNWARPGAIPIMQPNNWRVASISTSVGEHKYAIVEDGVWLTDNTAPMTAEYNNTEVSVGTAVDCETPALRVDDVVTDGTSQANITATFMSATSASRIDPASLVAKDRSGNVLAGAEVDADSGKIGWHVAGLSPGKYTYTITAKDKSGKVAEDARATVWIDGSSEAWDPRDAIVYQIMIDRFRGDSGPLAPPATPSARAGGTLAGVKAALDSGEISALGASAIWLSPLYTNPDGLFAGTDGREYSSYHGYWPKDSQGIDSKFATEAELDAFMADAHSKGIRVLFDVVPNHVHQEHPWVTQHPDWFKQDCICGQGSCDWGTHELTCWFAPYLPDFDWTNDTAAKAQSDQVTWWFDRFDADGIRIDAVPMMPRSATRRIATQARTRYQHPGHSLYVLGENFTDQGGYQSLRYDLGPYGLDGAFHFPLMWSIREAVAHEDQPLSSVEQSYREGEATWNGSGAVMGLMIGNHDVSRFASESAGNADGDTWTPPPQPIDPIVYAKQRLALATVLTMPGAPVIYYGDEVGLAGRSDPDCRRVMPDENSLLDAQLQTRAQTRALGITRQCSRPLRRGDLTTLLSDDEHFVFSRAIDGEMAIVVLTRRPTTDTTLPLPAGAPTDLVEVFSGKPLTGTTIPVPSDPFTVKVYVSAGSGCVVTQR